MLQFRRPPPLLRPLRSLFVQRLPITLRKKQYHCWQSPYLILRSSGSCSWNYPSNLKMKSAGREQREGWPDGPPTGPLTGSAIASDGMRSDTDRWCWDYHGRFQMSFVSLQKRTCRGPEITMADALTLPMADIAVLLHEGKVKARDLAEEAIANHERFGAALMAYSQWAPDHARKCADAADAAFAVGSRAGPLQGIPTSIKDLFALAAFRPMRARPSVCRQNSRSTALSSPIYGGNWRRSWARLIWWNLLS